MVATAQLEGEMQSYVKNILNHKLTVVLEFFCPSTDGGDQKFEALELNDSRD